MMNESDKELIGDIVTRRFNIHTNLKIIFLGDYEGVFSINPYKDEDYLVTILQLIRDLKDILHHDVVLKSLERKKTNYYTFILLI